ncbi:hypothetical protein DID76_03415 [Candidatus Marinamargulisbacteria bacterium SCGC AG-414-C22]|nr:hypothetical protein DID76_03415 [Candidatus Marinamargulisbacteria bacterium SCGC AG-414-C22]
MSTKCKPYIILLASCMLLGVSGLFAKIITLPAEVIITGRSLVAVAILFPFFYLQRSKVAIRSKRHVFWMFCVGVLMAAHWVTFYTAIKISSVAIGVIGVFLHPILSTLLEPIFTKKSFKWIEGWFCVVVILGVTLIASKDYNGINVVPGLSVGIMSALCMTFRNIIIRNINQSFNAMEMMFYQNFITVMILVGFNADALFAASFKNLALVAIVGITSSTIGHTLLVKSLEYLTATTVGILSSFQIIYAAVLAWAILNEPITMEIAVGGSMILYVIIHQLLVGENREVVGSG